MGKTLGRVAERVCQGCAIVFCAVILVQSLLTALSGQPLVVLAGLLAAGAALYLCMRFCPSSRYFPLVLGAVRFALALLFILWLNSQPVQDFQTMYAAAVQLSRGEHAYLENIYFYNWAYQSGFVAYEAGVMSLFGTSLLPLQLLNAVYMAFTNVLVYLIGRRILPERGAMAAGVLYALYPAPLFLAGVLTNQHLSVLLFYAAVYLLCARERPTPGRFVGAGTLIALGNAIRPIGVILVLAGGIWALLRCLSSKEKRELLQNLTSAAGLVAAYFLVGAALSALVVASGINPEGLVNHQPMWKFVIGLNQDSNGSWNQADYDAFLTLPTQEGDQAMRQAVRERLSAGPFRLAKLAWRKSAVMWGANEDLYWGFWHREEDAPARPLPLSWNATQLLLGRLDKGVYLLCFALAAAGVVLLLRRPTAQNRSLLLVLLLCGYYAVHLIVEVQSRYRYFLMPCVCLLAGVALSKILGNRTARRFV